MANNYRKLAHRARRAPHATPSTPVVKAAREAARAKAASKAVRGARAANGTVARNRGALRKAYVSGATERVGRRTRVPTSRDVAATLAAERGTRVSERSARRTFASREDVVRAARQAAAQRARRAYVRAERQRLANPTIVL